MVQRLAYFTMHKLLNSNWQYVAETEAEFERRYHGFGRELYAKIRNQMPDLYSGITLYSSEQQPTDSYALCENPYQDFVIQLDPETEVICFWSDSTRCEITSWSDNEYDEALKFIEDEFNNAHD